MKDAEIPGFFTNHSARRTGSTRLFRAGVQRKLIKETTGHRSNAVDKYQVTSDAQRESMLEILAKEAPSNVTEKPIITVESEAKRDPKPSIYVTDSNNSDPISVSASNVNEIISKVLELSAKRGKSTVKIQIEIINE